MNPRVRIIAASGLGTGQHAGEGALEGVAVFLTKPYTAEKLLRTLAQVLHG
jgi:DNA-binding NtrC family response regulator